MFHLVIERSNAITLVLTKYYNCSILLVVQVCQHGLAMVPGFYLFQLTPDAFCSDAMRHMHEFKQRGYMIKACATLNVLMHHVGAVQRVAGSRVITVIDGRDAGSSAAVSTLRTLPDRVGIIALVDRHDDATMIRLLQMGVDMCSFACASPDLWVASVSRLMWRLGSQTHPAVSNSPASGVWTLAEQGWAMCTPTGQVVALTTGERAFLMTLLNAPQQQAAHHELINAVNQAYNSSGTRTHQSRLGVMVSRMRRKFAQAGAPLPLKSIHNWGYMFCF